MLYPFKSIPRALDALLTSLHRSYSDMVFNVTRPNETKLNAIVEVRQYLSITWNGDFYCLRLSK